METGRDHRERQVTITEQGREAPMAAIQFREMPKRY